MKNWTNDGNDQSLFWKDSSIEHLFQAENILREPATGDILNDSSQQKKKLAYAHLLEFLIKNIAWLLAIGALIVATIRTLACFYMSVYAWSHFNVFPSSLFSYFDTFDVVAIVVCSTIVIVSPFALYIHLISSNYKKQNKKTKGEWLNYFCANSVCYLTIMVIFCLLLFYLIDFSRFTETLLLYALTVAVVSNLLAFAFNFSKDNVKTLLSSVAGVLIFYFVNQALFNAFYTYIKFSNKYLNMFTVIVTISIEIALIVVIKFRNIECSSTISPSSQKAENTKLRIFPLIATIIKKVSFVSIISIVALYVFLFLIATNPHNSNAWVTKISDEYYIAATSYGNNVCLERLSIDKDTKKKIDDAKEGASQEEITIKSRMLNTKVQKWVSKTDLETIQVTYVLEEGQ